MRYIKLSASERETLEQGYKNHSKSHFRQRCQTMLLSDTGWQAKHLAILYDIRSRTIYTWMDRWETMGIVGLMILPGRGLKPELSIHDSELVETIKKSPQVRSKLKEIGSTAQ